MTFRPTPGAALDDKLTVALNAGLGDVLAVFGSQTLEGSASQFNGDISAWDVSAVTNMYSSA